MMKLFPDNAQFDVSELTVDEMRVMIDMEMEHRKQVEAEIKRREHQAKQKNVIKRY